MKKDLSNQTAATYKMLRLGLAVLAFVFPPLLWLGGKISAGIPLAGSMSAYYHVSTPPPDLGEPGQGVMRNEFVGILFAVGVLLFAYQGYSRLEDIALNLAGILAFGVALFPMKWPPGGHDDGQFSLHGACAISFFVCIAYVCIWRARDTLPLIKDKTLHDRYLWTYRLFGWAMVAFPALTWLVISQSPANKSTIFFLEAAGIYVFAAYWTVKSHEASRTRVDEKATRGELHNQPHQLTDALRPLPVTE